MFGDVCLRENIKCILLSFQRRKREYSNKGANQSRARNQLCTKGNDIWWCHVIHMSLSATRQTECREVYTGPHTRVMCTFTKYQLNESKVRFWKGSEACYWQDLEVNFNPSVNLWFDFEQITFLCLTFLIFNMGIIISIIQSYFEEWKSCIQYVWYTVST